MTHTWQWSQLFYTLLDWICLVKRLAELTSGQDNGLNRHPLKTRGRLQSVCLHTPANISLNRCPVKESSKESSDVPGATSTAFGQKEFGWMLAAHCLPQILRTVELCF